MNSLRARTEWTETHQPGKLRQAAILALKRMTGLRNAGIPAGEKNNNILSSMFSQFPTRREEMHNTGDTRHTNNARETGQQRHNGANEAHNW